VVEGIRRITQPSERHHDRVSSEPGALGAEGTNGSAERDTLGAILPNTLFSVIWQALLMSPVDPFPVAAQAPHIVIDYLCLASLQSPLGRHALDIIEEISRANLLNFSLTLPTNPIPRASVPSPPVRPRLKDVLLLPCGYRRPLLPA